jgi:hypothetical protein
MWAIIASDTKPYAAGLAVPQIIVAAVAAALQRAPRYGLKALKQH